MLIPKPPTPDMCAGGGLGTTILGVAALAAVGGAAYFLLK